MTKARLLADYLSSAASAAVDEIVLGDSGDTKLLIPGLGFNTDLALDGQVVSWNDLQNKLVFTDAGSVDSAQTIAIVEETVDSAYINSKVTIPQSYGDSDVVLLVDSNYVQHRVKNVYAGDRTFETYRFVSAEGQSLYTGNDANGNILSYSPSSLQVHLNGILLTPGVDYVATNGTSITLQDSIGVGNEILVENFQTKFIVDISQLVDSAYVVERIPRFSSTTDIGSFKFTTSGPQTVFTGFDDNGNSLSFDSGNTIVFLNGVNLYSPSDYYTTNGNTITLTEATDSDFQLIAYDFNKYFTSSNANNILSLSSDAVPDSSGSAGVKGTVIVNNTYMYICKEDNVWVRTTIDGIW